MSYPTNVLPPLSYFCHPFIGLYRAERLLVKLQEQYSQEFLRGQFTLKRADQQADLQERMCILHDANELKMITVISYVITLTAAVALACLAAGILSIGAPAFTAKIVSTYQSASSLYKIAINIAFVTAIIFFYLPPILVTHEYWKNQQEIEKMREYCSSNGDQIEDTLQIYIS